MFLKFEKFIYINYDFQTSCNVSKYRLFGQPNGDNKYLSLFTVLNIFTILLFNHSLK